MVKMLVFSNVNKLVNVHLAFAIPVSKFNFCQTTVLIYNKYNLFQLVWYGVIVLPVFYYLIKLIYLVHNRPAQPA